jgi:hypothetical protein
MSDTIRDKAALQALLADNVTGDITPQRVRDMLVSLYDIIGPGSFGDGGSSNYTGFDISGKQIFYGNAGLCYGEIYVKGNSTPLALTTQNTWYQFVGFDTDGLSKNTTPDHTNDHIRIDEDGKYLVSASIYGDIAAANTDKIEFQIYKNNGNAGFDNLFQPSSRLWGNGFPVSLSGLVTLTALDTVELWARNVSDSGENLIIENAVLSVLQVGG